jgi:hypothetical protein
MRHHVPYLLTKFGFKIQLEYKEIKKQISLGVYIRPIEMV